MFNNPYFARFLSKEAFNELKTLKQKGSQNGQIVIILLAALKIRLVIKHSNADRVT